MLFDLQGKRRNVIRVVYAMLAVIMVGGTVMLGIGTDVGAGLSSLFGIDSSGQSTGNSDAASIYEQQLEDTQELLAADPENPDLLLEAARLAFLNGAQLTTRDEDENMVATPESNVSWNQALDYWTDYLATEPDKPEITVAGQMVFAARMMEDAVTAANIQELVVEENPTDVGYRDLALFLYAQGRIEDGEAAAKEAIRLTSDEEKEEAKEWKRELHKQSVEYRDQLEAIQEAQSNGEEAPPQLPSPFGTLGQTPGQLPPGFGQ